MKRFWISWWHPGGAFELHTPWWRSGWDEEGRASICAAVLAHDEEDAMRVVTRAYEDFERASDIEWRFVHERPADWSPFSERFQRADWMQWPAGLAKREAGR